jgi:NAD-dependent SIR2 family protein deacetylase
MIACIATAAVDGKRLQARGSTATLACSHCHTDVRNRQQERERSAQLAANARAAGATALTLAAGAAAAISVLIVPSTVTVVTGLVGLVVAHVLAAFLAPRVRRRFTT